MEKFKNLCRIIIATNGNPSVKQVLECGYTMEHFLRMAAPNVKTERLVENAKRMLQELNNK